MERPPKSAKRTHSWKGGFVVCPFLIQQTALYDVRVKQETPVVEPEILLLEDDEVRGQSLNGEEQGGRGALERSLAVTDAEIMLSKRGFYGVIGVALVVACFVAVVLGLVLSNGGSGDDSTKGITTIAPTVGDNRFSSARDELIEAVNNYLVDSSPNTTTAQAYGWPIGVWWVGRVKNFEDVFNADRNSRAATFNEPLHGWDMSNAVQLTNMFRGAVAFNQDLSPWDVSRATSMRGTFHGATAFNGNVSTWNTSSVTDFSSAFAGARLFVQSLEAWNISKGTDFTKMFYEAHAFAQDLCAWGDAIDKNALVTDMFIGTDCPENDTATDLSAMPPGPFCLVCS